MSPSADRPAEQPDRQARVFLSYSRQDLIFATRLVEALKQHTIDAYLDKKDIAPSEDWKERLAALIVSADAVLFLLTPNSAASTVCGWEIQEASRHGKRLIPILHREPSGTDVPTELSRLNYIYLREADNFASRLEAIVAAINTHIQWVREHTRLEERAQRWRKDGQPHSDILRGEVLVAAETWLGLRPKAGPPITDLQTTFISESRRLYDAEEHEKKDTLDRFFISQSRYLCERASEAMDSDVLAGLLLALEAVPDPANRVSVARERPLIGEAESALRTALHALYDLRFLKGFEGHPDLAVFNADGTLVLACKEGGDAEVWSVATGQRLHALRHAGKVTNGAFSRKGDRLATVEDRTSQIWDVESGNRLAICTGHTDQITSAVFSPDGTRLLTVSADRTCRMWDATTGALAALFRLQDATAHECLGPRGAQTIVPTWDSAGRIFRDDLYRPCVRIPSIGDRGRALLSPNAEQILTWSAQTILQIWNARTGLSEWTLNGTSAPVAAAIFSGDCLNVHALFRDGSGGVWDVGGANISRFHLQVEGVIKLATFSADGSRVATVVEQSRSVEVWDPLDGRRVKAKEVDDDWIKAIQLSPTGSELVVICEYGRAFVNVAGDDRTGTALNRHDEDVLDANFSRNGDRLVTATARNTAKVYRRIQAGDFAWYGQVLQHGPGRMDDGVRSAVFNADGSKVLTSSVDGTVRTWEAESGRQTLCLDLGKRRKYPDARSLPEVAAFSPADAWLTLIDEEQRLRIWRTETGQEIDLGQVDPENVASVAIDKSETHLFITHRDGTNCLFRDFFWFGHLVELTKTFAPRGLTADERRRYHLDPKALGWCVEMRKWPYFYLEDSPLDHVGLNSYGQFIMAFRDPTVMGIEIALRTTLNYMTPDGSESIKMLADTMHAEYWERLRRNQTRLKNTDDFELTAESFQQVLCALKNLGFADAAREMLSEYKGPAPTMPFSI